MSSSKRARVLELLLLRGNRGLNRFEATQLAHDHVLPSTIAALHKLGVSINAESETVPGHAGHPTRLARYRIVASERERARQILGSMMKKAPAAGTASASGTIGERADVQTKAYH